MREDYRSGTVEDVNPGADKLPGWVQALAPLVLIAFIVIGGFWLRRMEEKARAMERQRREASKEEPS